MFQTGDMQVSVDITATFAQTPLRLALKRLCIANAVV